MRNVRQNRTEARERAILVGVVLPRMQIDDVEDHLDELEGGDALDIEGDRRVGVEAVGELVVGVERADIRTGKVADEVEDVLDALVLEADGDRTTASW